MKDYLFLLLILIVISTNGLAQDSASHKKQHKLSAVYFAINGGEANGKFIFGWEATIITKKGWGINYGVKASIYESKLLPKDYKPGTGLFGGNYIPTDEIFIYTFSTTKYFRLKQNKIIPGLETGITYIDYSFFSTFEHVEQGFDFSSNYRSTHETKHALGLLIKPKLQFILSKNIGVETSAWTILNKIENYYGVEVNLLIGRLK